MDQRCTISEIVGSWDLTSILHADQLLVLLPSLRDKIVRYFITTYGSILSFKIYYLYRPGSWLVFCSGILSIPVVTGADLHLIRRLKDSLLVTLWRQIMVYFTNYKWLVVIIVVKWNISLSSRRPHCPMWRHIIMTEPEMVVNFRFFSETKKDKQSWDFKENMNVLTAFVVIANYKDE